MNQYSNGSKRAMPREESFLEVEYIFRTYLEGYPNALEVQCPAGVTPASFGNRLRRNAQEFISHKWACSIDAELFGQAWENREYGRTLVGVQPSGSILIGTRRSGHNYKVNALRHSGAVAQRMEGQTVTVEVDAEALEALMILHEKGIFPKGTYFPKMSDEQFEAIRAELWASGRNVGMTKHPGGEPGYFMT